MINQLDPENMEQVIIDSPQQYIEGYKAGAALDFQPENKMGRVLLAGMGGSWMAAALLRDAGLASAPINIHRAYGLPNWADKNTFVIASSFSGNTEETISAYEVAREKGLTIIGVASGGELETRCKKDNVPFVKIPANPPTIQPRCATGYSIGIFASLFEKFGLGVTDAEKQIQDIVSHLTNFMQTARERGESLAPSFADKTPVIYTCNEYKSVARIWKIKCNENAKTPAFWNYFPEMNHNEMVGWTTPHGKFGTIFLRDEEGHPRILKRMDITSKLLEERGISVMTVPMQGKNKAEKVFSTLLTGDWFSYKLALTLGIDPTPVAMVEDLKKRLKE